MSNEHETRRCNTCLEIKPMIQFSPNKGSVGGRLPKCKACRSKQNNTDRKAKAVPKDKPTSWVLPADTRKPSEKALDVELRMWPANEPANNLFWRISA